MKRRKGAIIPAIPVKFHRTYQLMLAAYGEQAAKEWAHLRLIHVPWAKTLRERA